MSKRNREIGDKEPVSSDTKRVKVAKSDPTELTHNDYAVGWICALPKERAAAMAILDQRHRDLVKPEGDKNAYTLGSIGKHNVVIACLPKGRYGTYPAAIVATQMVHTFPSIKLGLMVGIGGGIPLKVRLGDVVISTPGDQFPGVVQWDMGKAKEGGKFERTGVLDNPPDAFLTALTAMEAEHDMTGSKVPEYLDELKQKWPKMAKQYMKSDSLKDILFRADYSHISGISTGHYANPGINDGEEDAAENRAGDETEDETENGEEESCRFCDKSKIIKRNPRRKMRVHYGLIASGNQVIKDATFRDKLNEDLGGNILCVEMEAAGLMVNFPCIVIRGICDYADSHKNKAWQKHAAAVAAAVAKELLGHVQPSDVEGERTVKDILDEGKLASQENNSYRNAKFVMTAKQIKQRIEEVHQQVVDGFVGAKASLDNLWGGTDVAHCKGTQYTKFPYRTRAPKKKTHSRLALSNRLYYPAE